MASWLVAKLPGGEMTGYPAFNTVNESCRVSEGNSTCPEATFLTLQHGES